MFKEEVESRARTAQTTAVAVRTMCWCNCLSCFVVGGFNGVLKVNAPQIGRLSGTSGPQSLCLRSRVSYVRSGGYKEAVGNAVVPSVVADDVGTSSVTDTVSCMQFGKDFAESKYDWKQEGRQQLLLPSEYKKAVSAKAPAPVISWHPKIISCCWKIACRCRPVALCCCC